MLKWLARFGARISIPLSARDTPEAYGLRLWIKGPNADLYEQRLTEALALLAVVAPTYLRWLRARILVLDVSPTNAVTGLGAWEADFFARFASFNPRYIYRLTPELLALALGRVAIRARLNARGVHPAKVDGWRFKRLLLRFELHLAHRLPNTEGEVVRIQREIQKVVGHEER